MEVFSEQLDAIGIPRQLSLVTGTNGHSRNLRFLVTGGCGYFAAHLAKALYALGAHVCLFDLELPSHVEKLLDNRFTFFKGDVRSYSSILNAATDADCVFHVASYGLSGVSQWNKQRIEEVNVTGTENVIQACQENGIERLIYTSTYNVVLGWDPILNGNEDLPYADPAVMVDDYSRSKLKADKLVLEANGSEVEGGGVLKTCCIRPSGIFGPEEQRHMKRIMHMIESGLIFMKPGDCMCDWVHVNNLVQAHLLAVPGLSASSGSIAAGQAYFISDNRPMLMFEFLGPLFTALGYQVPARSCPFYLLYFVAYFLELLHYLLRPIYVISPILTRNEVMKLTVDHYHSMQKAIKELGYEPRRYEYADTVQLFLEQRKRADDPIMVSGGWWMRWGKYLFVIILIFALVAVAI